WFVFSSYDPLRFEHSIEIVPAGVIRDGQAVLGRRVQPADGEPVVGAVGVDVAGGAVHILGPAVHLFPQGDLVFLDALGGAAGGDGQAVPRHLDIAGVPGPDAVVHPVPGAVGYHVGPLGGGVGAIGQHDGVGGGFGPVGGVHLLGAGKAQHIGHVVLQALAAGQAKGQRRGQQQGGQAQTFFLPFHKNLRAKRFLPLYCSFTGLLYRIFLLHTTVLARAPSVGGVGGGQGGALGLGQLGPGRVLEQGAVPVQGVAPRAGGPQGAHLVRQGPPGGPARNAVPVGPAVPLADPVSPQAHVQRRAAPGHGQPLGQDVLIGKPPRPVGQGVPIPPVELRAEVIHHRVLAAGGQPAPDVAVLLAHVVVRVALGADPKPQGGVGGLDGVVGGLDQGGDVLPPPFGQVGRAAGRKPGRVDGGVGGGVEVVVEVDAVHRVGPHQL